MGLIFQKSARCSLNIAVTLAKSVVCRFNIDLNLPFRPFAASENGYRRRGQRSAASENDSFCEVVNFPFCKTIQIMKGMAMLKQHSGDFVKIRPGWTDGTFIYELEPSVLTENE